MHAVARFARHCRILLVSAPINSDRLQPGRFLRRSGFVESAPRTGLRYCEA
jgi:hypothetical protein